MSDHEVVEKQISKSKVDLRDAAVRNSSEYKQVLDTIADLSIKMVIEENARALDGVEKDKNVIKTAELLERDIDLSVEIFTGPPLSKIQSRYLELLIREGASMHYKHWYLLALYLHESRRWYGEFQAIAEEVFSHEESKLKNSMVYAWGGSAVLNIQGKSSYMGFAQQIHEDFLELFVGKLGIKTDESNQENSDN